MTQTDTGPGGWRSVFADMFDGARRAVVRFPITSCALFLLALDAHLSIADVEWIRQIGWHLSLGLVGAAAASLATALFCESRDYGVGATIAVSLIVAALAFSAIWYADQTRAWEFIILPALAGLVLVAPYLLRGSASGFWLFVLRFAFAVVLGIMALLLAAGGISAILASLTYLFGFDIPNDLYAHVWALTGCFLAPVFGLGRIPYDFDTEIAGDDDQYMAIGMRALGDFVAAPILIVYALVLHAYAVKVIVAAELPKGQVGWLVLGYGFCVFGSLMLTYPFWKLARPPLRLLLKFWPWVMPVPLALLFYAAWLRIDQYGVTPERYLLVLFGITAAAIVLSQLISQLRGDIRVMAVLPVLALCVASVGPLGAVGWSLQSQTNRFWTLLEKAKEDREAEADAVSLLGFLARFNGLSLVAPEDLELSKRPYWRRGNAYEDTRLVAEAYGLNPDVRVGGGSERFFQRYFQTEAVSIPGGYDLVLTEVPLTNNVSVKRQFSLGNDEKIVLALAENAILAEWRGQTIRFDIPNDFLMELAAVGEMEPRAIEMNAQRRQLTLVFRNVYGEREPETKIINMFALVLLRSTDWR